MNIKYKVITYAEMRPLGAFVYLKKIELQFEMIDKVYRLVFHNDFYQQKLNVSGY